METRTQSASKLLGMMLDAIATEATRQINEAVLAEAEQLGLPPGTRFDPERRVFLLPGDPEEPGE